MTTVIVEAPVTEVAPASTSAVAALVRSCSPEALRDRFFMAARPDPEVVLAHYRHHLLAGPPAGVAVVALLQGCPVGLLNLVVAGDGLVDLAVLVADDWQQRRVASRLLAGELATARWAGWTVRATIRSENRAALGLLRGQRVGAVRLAGTAPGELDYEVTLPGPPSRA